jgi:hypothetical protein
LIISTDRKQIITYCCDKIGHIMKENKHS